MRVPTAREGKETQDDKATKTPAFSGADRKKASGCGCHAQRGQGTGGRAAGPGSERGNLSPLAQRAPTQGVGRGGMKSEEARRLKQLEDENRQLKEIVAEKELDNRMLKHLMEGNW